MSPSPCSYFQSLLNLFSNYFLIALIWIVTYLVFSRTICFHIIFSLFFVTNLYSHRLIPKERVDMAKLLLYFIHKLDPIVMEHYVLVICTSGQSSQNRPNFSWMKRLYNIFKRKYVPLLQTFSWFRYRLERALFPLPLLLFSSPPSSLFLPISTLWFSSLNFLKFGNSQVFQLLYNDGYNFSLCSYKKNVMGVYIVHPTTSMKMFFLSFRVFKILIRAHILY